MLLVPRHLKLTKQNVKCNDHHSLLNINIPDCDKPCGCSVYSSKKTIFENKVSKHTAYLKNTPLELDCLVDFCYSLTVFKELHSSTFNSEQIKYMRECVSLNINNPNIYFQLPNKLPFIRN